MHARVIEAGARRLAGVVVPPRVERVVVRGSTLLSARELTGGSTFENAELLARAELTHRDAKKMDRFAILALAAVRELTNDLTERERAECGFVCGNMMAGWTFAEPQLRALHARGPADVSPYLASSWFPAAPQGQIAIHAGVRGYAKTLATDRCAGAQAIGHAWRHIASGRSRLMIAGGVEAPVAPFVEAAMRQGGQSADTLAEAAAFLLLGAEGSGDGVSTLLRAHCSFSLDGSGAAGVTRRLAALLEVLVPPQPSVVVCAASPEDAQSALVMSIIRDLFPTSRPELVFSAHSCGETLGAASAVAAAIAHQFVRSRAADDAAMVFTLGQFSADALWLQTTT